MGIPALRINWGSKRAGVSAVLVQRPLPLRILPTGPPLLVSNNPESLAPADLAGGQAVSLSAATVAGPARVFFHHHNATGAPLALGLAVQAAGPAVAAVTAAGVAVAPLARDAGRRAAVAWLAGRGARAPAGAGLVAPVAPPGPVALAPGEYRLLVAAGLPPEQVASGCLDLALAGPGGAPVPCFLQVVVWAGAPPAAPVAALAPLRLPLAGPLRVARTWDGAPLPEPFRAQLHTRAVRGLFPHASRRMTVHGGAGYFHVANNLNGSAASRWVAGEYEPGVTPGYPGPVWLNGNYGVDYDVAVVLPPGTWRLWMTGNDDPRPLFAFCTGELVARAMVDLTGRAAVEQAPLYTRSLPDHGALVPVAAPWQVPAGAVLRLLTTIPGEDCAPHRYFLEPL